MCKSDNANASVRISSSPLQLIQCWLFICECEREWEWERVKWPNRSLVFDLVYVRPFSLCMANCQTVFFVQFVLIRTAKMRLLLERMPATGATFTQSGASWPSFIQRNIQIPFHERIILIPPLSLSLSLSMVALIRVCVASRPWNRNPNRNGTTAVSRSSSITANIIQQPHNLHCIGD